MLSLIAGNGPRGRALISDWLAVGAREAGFAGVGAAEVVDGVDGVDGVVSRVWTNGASGLPQLVAHAGLVIHVGNGHGERLLTTICAECRLCSALVRCGM